MFPFPFPFPARVVTWTSFGSAPATLGTSTVSIPLSKLAVTPSGGQVHLTLRRRWRAPDGSVTDGATGDAVPVAQLAVRYSSLGMAQRYRQGLPPGSLS